MCTVRHDACMYLHSTQRAAKHKKEAKSMAEAWIDALTGHISHCISTDADKKCAEYTETHIILTQ